MSQNKQFGLLLVGVLVFFAIMMAGLMKFTQKPKAPTYAFAMNECIAATANINEYRHSENSIGYPVGKVKAITEDGYAVLIFIPDLNFYGTATIPFSKEVEFQSVHCPQALGGDEI